MNCPQAVADTLLEIIRVALLRIRHLGWGNKPEECAREADHIHNLPALLRNYSPELLQYYWEVERPSFIESAAADLGSFDLLWSKLGDQVAKLAVGGGQQKP
jgi:hypothetical protein